PLGGWLHRQRDGAGRAQRPAAGGRPGGLGRRRRGLAGAHRGPGRPSPPGREAGWLRGPRRPGAPPPAPGDRGWTQVPNRADHPRLPVSEHDQLPTGRAGGAALARHLPRTPARPGGAGSGAQTAGRSMSARARIALLAGVLLSLAIPRPALASDCFGLSEFYTAIT